MKTRTLLLIQICVVIGLVGTREASAQVSYELRWRNLTNLWWALYPNDPQPICLGNPKGVDVALYRCVAGDCYRVSDVDCYNEYVDPAIWSTSGGQTNFDFCITRIQGSISWPDTGVYSVSASMNYYGNTANTVSPSQLSIAIWKPTSVVPSSYAITPGSSTTAYVNVTPSATHFHGTAPITVTASGVDNTGGHSHPHVNGAPAGTCSVPVGIQAGRADFTYTASQISQVEGLRAAACNVNTSSNYIIVWVSGLVQLGSSVDYDLVGQTPSHPSNHYLTSSARAEVIATVQTYNGDPGTVNTIGINDCSLVTGGLFDISANWQTPHQSHRLGNNVDFRVSNLTGVERAILIDAIQDYGTYLDEGNHIHATY